MCWVDKLSNLHSALYPFYCVQYFIFFLFLTSDFQYRLLFLLFITLLTFLLCFITPFQSIQPCSFSPTSLVLLIPTPLNAMHYFPVPPSKRFFLLFLPLTPEIFKRNSLSLSFFFLLLNFPWTLFPFPSFSFYRTSLERHALLSCSFFKKFLSSFPPVNTWDILTHLSFSFLLFPSIKLPLNAMHSCTVPPSNISCFSFFR